jgi:hypothetical protein
VRWYCKMMSLLSCPVEFWRQESLSLAMFLGHNRVHEERDCDHCKFQELSSACPAHMILVIGICRSTIFSSDTSTLSFTLFAIFFPFSDRIVSTNNRYPCLVLFLMETDQCVLAAHSSVHLEGSCELNAGVCSTPLLLHLSPQIGMSCCLGPENPWFFFLIQPCAVLFSSRA